jgi:glycogen debranching enzyme
MNNFSWPLRAAGFLLLLILLANSSFAVGHAAAQNGAPANSGLAGDVTLDTEAVGPQRFVAVHGRRALIDGYATESLEVWAYPFQILSGYRVAFLSPGATSAIPGPEILRRVTYTPSSITRVYVGPDFVVHETLFVPLERPGAIITYRVQCKHPLNIELHAAPILNLMWPAALGGQSVSWSSALSAYILSESTDGYTAVIGSPSSVAHDAVENSTSHGVADTGLGFTLSTNHEDVARVYIALNPPHTDDTGALFNSLLSDRSALEYEAESHYRIGAEKGFRIETPDERVNRALAWSQIALDQAWVCNPELGCGFVAGYGPSRGARRPQYDWFFAGDGLIATDAVISSGDFARARQELEFILRYQNAKTGMIWHELSQSAGFLDWAGKYPYMFVHVDITFQFLGTVAQYVKSSGDTQFARDHWSSIQSAYGYCLSLVDRKDGLPRIPADKEGGDEQDRPADDLSLSVSWVEAASSFAQLADLTGHAAMADEARRSEELARASIPNRYWDQRQNFWIGSHTSSGEPIIDKRSPPSEALALHLFSAAKNDLMLDQLSSSAFQTDWGTRSIGAGSDSFDPESYSKGSVSAAHTAGVATGFWSEHRPAAAFEMWSALLPWFSLDSLGHMHEVAGGSVYHPQIESVPEQTWSSAGFLSGTVRGLLGLQVDSIARRVIFSPHLPPTWNSISIANLHISDTSIALTLRRSSEGLQLTIDNPSKPFELEFTPEIPLGARLGKSTLNGKAIKATVESHAQELDAAVKFDAPSGKSELYLKFEGGISVIAEPTVPVIGEPSSGLHLVNVGVKDGVLTIDAYVPSSIESRVKFVTLEGIDHVTGAKLLQVSPGVFELVFPASGDAASVDPYRRAQALVRFKPIR